MLRYDLAFLTGDQAEWIAKPLEHVRGPERQARSPTKRRLRWRTRVACTRPREVSAARYLRLSRPRNGRGLLCGGLGTHCGRPSSEICPKQKKSATATLEQSKDRAVEYGSALALAMSG